MQSGRPPARSGDALALKWRHFHGVNGTLGFSFAYLIVDAVKRADGIREIRKLDVFEISATATPMNTATRVLSTEAVDAAYKQIRSSADHAGR